MALKIVSGRSQALAAESHIQIHSYSKLFCYGSWLMLSVK